MKGRGMWRSGDKREGGRGAPAWHACRSGGQFCAHSKGTLFENLLSKMEAAAVGFQRPGIRAGPHGAGKARKECV